jgi:hypothetical protein
MKAMTKGLLTIALLATAACDGAPTASNEFVSTVDGPSFAQSPSSTLSFGYQQSNTTRTNQSSTGGVGRIDFAGSLVTGTPCFDVSAAHTDRNGAVTVTVSGSDNGGICTQVITYNNYTGSVTGLAAGTYTFTVVHNLGGSRTTAHTNTVVVQ